MNPSERLNVPTPKKQTLPRWLGVVFWVVGLPLAHGWIPWRLSRLAPRAGWVKGRPGPWNWPGLGLVGAGHSVVVWGMGQHFEHAPAGWELERTPSYLLRRGPYAFSRNPMYVAELGIWLGFAVFFGSLPVLAGLVLIMLTLGRVVADEERRLEARFGEAYRAYQRQVPRWVGRPR